MGNDTQRTAPSYYIKNGKECYSVIETITEGLSPYEGYLVGCVIKYLWRFKNKNGTEDLIKAKRYVEELIEVQDGET